MRRRAGEIPPAADADAYREMAKDADREADALEWADALLGDAAGEQP